MRIVTNYRHILIKAMLVSFIMGILITILMLSILAHNFDLTKVNPFYVVLIFPLTGMIIAVLEGYFIQVNYTEITEIDQIL